MNSGYFLRRQFLGFLEREDLRSSASEVADLSGQPELDRVDHAVLPEPVESEIA
jgi:hypothetical protein